MDPTEAISLAISGLRAVGAVGKFMEQRERRKTVEARHGSPAINPSAPAASLTPTERAARSDAFRRDIFVVLGVLGEKLFALGLVNEAWLPSARGEVLKVLRLKGNAPDGASFAAIFEEDMEEPMQSAVTAALFLCAGCWPMPVYRGFGAGVLNEWQWASPAPGVARDNAPEAGQVDDCIALLKTAPLGHAVLFRYPQGLSTMTASFGKSEAAGDVVWYLDHKLGQIKKRGLPQPRDRSFGVGELLWPWSTYDSAFALQNRFSHDFSSLGAMVKWQQDPGRMLYGFLVGGFLELQPGQMIEATNDIAASILRWLFGLRGTTFKLLVQGELDISHWQMKAKYQRKWDEGLAKVVYAVRDDHLVRQRDAARNLMLPSSIMSPSAPSLSPHLSTSPKPVTEAHSAISGASVSWTYASPPTNTATPNEQSTPAPSTAFSPTQHQAAPIWPVYPGPSQPQTAPLGQVLPISQAPSAMTPGSKTASAPSVVPAQQTPSFQETTPPVDIYQYFSPEPTAAVSPPLQRTVSDAVPTRKPAAQGHTDYFPADPTPGHAALHHTQSLRAATMPAESMFPTSPYDSRTSRPTIQTGGTGVSIAAPTPRSSYQSPTSILVTSPVAMNTAASPSQQRNVSIGSLRSTFDALNISPVQPHPESNRTQATLFQQPQATPPHQQATAQYTDASYATDPMVPHFAQTVTAQTYPGHEQPVPTRPTQQPQAQAPNPSTALRNWPVYTEQAPPAPSATTHASDPIVPPPQNLTQPQPQPQPATKEPPPTHPAPTPTPSPPPAYSLRKVTGQFDFAARSGAEMSFRSGDVLEILRDSSGDGWLLARKAGEEGRVPEAYVSPC